MIVSAVPDCAVCKGPINVCHGCPDRSDTPAKEARRLASLAGGESERIDAARAVVARALEVVAVACRKADETDELDDTIQSARDVAQETWRMLRALRGVVHDSETLMGIAGLSEIVDGCEASAAESAALMAVVRCDYRRRAGPVGVVGVAGMTCDAPVSILGFVRWAVTLPRGGSPTSLPAGVHDYRGPRCLGFGVCVCGATDYPADSLGEAPCSGFAQ